MNNGIEMATDNVQSAGNGDNKNTTTPASPPRSKAKENIVSKWTKNFFHKLLIASCFPVNNKLANKIIVFFLLSFLGWLFVFLVTGSSALPGGLYFSLIVLVVCAHSFGYLIELIKMPSLLGMLIVGIFFKNVPVLSIVGKSVDSNTSSILRYYKMMSLSLFLITFYLNAIHFIKKHCILCDFGTRWVVSRFEKSSH
jgi:hypothetical protein